MMNDIAERTDLNRFADDGCPHLSGETQTFDLREVWDRSTTSLRMGSSRRRSTRAAKAERSGAAMGAASLPPPCKTLHFAGA